MSADIEIHIQIVRARWARLQHPPSPRPPTPQNASLPGHELPDAPRRIKKESAEATHLASRRARRTRGGQAPATSSGACESLSTPSVYRPSPTARRARTNHRRWSCINEPPRAARSPSPFCRQFCANMYPHAHTKVTKQPYAQQDKQVARPSIRIRASARTILQRRAAAQSERFTATRPYCRPLQRRLRHITPPAAYLHQFHRRLRRDATSAARDTSKPPVERAQELGNASSPARRHIVHAPRVPPYTPSPPPAPQKAERRKPPREIRTYPHNGETPHEGEWGGRTYISALGARHVIHRTVALSMASSYRPPAKENAEEGNRTITHHPGRVFPRGGFTGAQENCERRQIS
ncbi:hypothetical protein DFH09DRAFT_1378854 [Mycena vulgaris]|nr:hypothetical protein DFH09DRAFT_1378854 [Mycena vulgaris]